MSNRKFLLFYVILLAFPAALRGQTYDPGATMEKANSLIQSARKAESRKEYPPALEDYRKAVKYLLFLRKKFPDYEPARIKATGRECREKIASMEDKIYQLPDGYVRVWPGMSRKRFSKAPALESKVEKLGQDEYTVNKFTVKLTRVGSKIGAKCSCPDFMYRALKGDFPCKHIWAVTLKEKLFTPQKEKK